MLPYGDTDWSPRSRSAINGFQSEGVNLCTEFLYNKCFQHLWYQSIKAMITQRAKWERVIATKGGDGTQPPAENPQASQEQHLPHLLLKMFDSRQSLLPMTFLCSAVVWSCCVNMPSLCNAWTRQTFKRNKGTSVHCSFKQTTSSFKFLSESSFQTAIAPCVSTCFEEIFKDLDEI